MSLGLFEDDYKLGKTLGSGAFATVKEGKSKKDSKTYAIKIFDKSSLSQLDNEALSYEISILTSLNHNHIIKLYSVYDEPDQLYLVTELVTGGELFDRIVSKKTYTEKEARDVCRVLFHALGYCQELGIAHRDLKPENLLLLNDDNDTDLKVADFGFAKRVPKNGKLMTSCGTPRYVAPEIILGKGHDTKVDCWSLGVIIYILLAGYAPFGGKPRPVLFRRILSGKFIFHDQYWSSISDDAKDLIQCLLTTNPEKRISAKDALEHSWMKVDDVSIDKEMNLEMLKAFQANKRFRKAAHVVSAIHKMSASTLFNLKNSSLGVPQDLQLSSEPEFEPTESFVDCYILGEKLGKGSFGTVKEATSQKDNKKYAIKIIEKSRLTPEDEEAVFDEINILKSLHHANIIRLYSVFNEVDAIFLVTELVDGGELFDRVVSKTNYTEKEARDTVKTLLEAVGFCHGRNIAHRDLKPENLLLLSDESDSEVKLADFGFAKHINPENPNCLTTQCGTPEYVAPEVIAGVKYGVKADMWSLGVISYILLSGYLPFHGSNMSKMFKRIVKGEYKFHDQYWSEISEDAKDFVRCLLQLDFKVRLSAEDALNHPWIAASNEDALLRNSLESTITNLKKFNAGRKFRAAGKAVISICALQRKLNSLGPIGSFDDINLHD